MKSRWKTKAPCGNEGAVCDEGAVCRRRCRTRWRTDEDVGTRNRRKNEPSAEEAMPKTIERTLSGSEMAPPFHRARRISLKYCAAYFSRKYGVCVAIAYFFPGRVQRLLLPRYASSTLEVH